MFHIQIYKIKYFKNSIIKIRNFFYTYDTGNEFKKIKFVVNTKQFATLPRNINRSNPNIEYVISIQMICFKFNIFSRILILIISL